MNTLNLKEAASLLHVSKSFLAEQARQGIVRASKPGRKWVFLESDLEDHLTNLAEEIQSRTINYRECIKSWQFSNAEKSGGLGLQHRMAKEYAKALGLPIEKPHSTYTTS